MPLHWQADSEPLDHQGSPSLYLLSRICPSCTGMVIFSPLYFVCILLLQERCVQVQALQQRAPGPNPSQTCREDRSLQHEWMHEGIMSHVIYNLHIMSPLPCVLWVRSQSQATPHSRGRNAARVRPLGGEVHFRSCLPHCLGFPGGSVVKNLLAMKETWV